MYRRKEFEKEDEDHQERWLLSYADLITLLFAFFVVMYATSTINLNKYRDVSKAVVTAFQGDQDAKAAAGLATKPANPTTVVPPLPLAHVYAQKKLRDQEKLHDLAQSLANALGPYIEQQTVYVLENKQGIHVDISAMQLFNAQHTLTTDGQALLALMLKALKLHVRPMMIEGHAAIANAPQYVQSWQITAQQSAQVVQYLVFLGLPAKQLRAVALADTQPKSIGDSALSNMLNQRISLVIPLLESEAQQAQDDSTEVSLLPMTAERLLATTQAESASMAAHQAPTTLPLSQTAPQTSLK